MFFSTRQITVDILNHIIQVSDKIPPFFNDLLSVLQHLNVPDFQCFP